jgi:hypothetical protein
MFSYPVILNELKNLPRRRETLHRVQGDTVLLTEVKNLPGQTMIQQLITPQQLSSQIVFLLRPPSFKTPLQP